MRCRWRGRNISQWLDGELKATERAELEMHLGSCPICKQEVEAWKKLHNLIQMGNIDVEPSSDFEATFWEKVSARSKEPWLTRVFKSLEASIPIPNLAQVFVVLLFAFFVGGAGGALSAMNTLTPQRVEGATNSIRYLSGFQEFKGVPSSSMTAVYLRTSEKRSLR